MMRKIALAIVLAVAAFAGLGAIGKSITIGDVTFYYQISDVGSFCYYDIVVALPVEA